MGLECKKNGTVFLFYLSGELDHHSCIPIREELDKVICHYHVKRAIFDFSAVSFMDSAGIGLLLGRYREIAKLGGKCVILCESEKIKKILQMGSVQLVMPIVETKQEAYEKLGGTENGTI